MRDSDRPSGSRSSTTIQSVGRSLDLLEALALRDEIGLVELSAQVELLPSTAHRLLATLAKRGYVTQNPETGRYLLSYKVLELAALTGQRLTYLRAVARPLLEEICRIVGETTKLVLLEDTSIVYVDHVESSRSVRGFVRIGQSLPAHAAASGKAILAFQDVEAVARVMAASSFGFKLTPNTVASKEEFEDELKSVRVQGYSVDNEEHEQGVMCVAAPILDHAGTARAAISISGPAERVRNMGEHQIGVILRDRAREISAKLGYQPDSAEPTEEETRNRSRVGELAQSQASTTHRRPLADA